jgi:aryl-alcohol dehydrogenase-like predicted oxidoreductase
VSAAGRAALSVAPSRLGFGCASLGSRIAANDGLDALAAAFDAGVNWFDVAPAYGAGEAETLLGRFLRGRRDRAIVVTKVGMAPPSQLGALKLIYRLGRPIAARAATLRRGFRSLAATRNRHLPLTAELIERSIGESLRRLGVDAVDVYALHDPDPADVARDEVRTALERVLQRGQARAIGVAGGFETCRAALAAGEPYSALQTSAAALDYGGAELSGAGLLLISHSVFGVGGGALGQLCAKLASAPERHRRLVACGYSADSRRAAAELLLDCALANNPDGVVLASMFDADHRAADLARARRRASALALGLRDEALA